ncbi:hypothetical protein OF83DRAFT_395044 [Amylostereum chailletii]|nr:hypothetical protein OF83DRAFT_395044 [Amylostereum chailletii]
MAFASRLIVMLVSFCSTVPYHCTQFDVICFRTILRHPSSKHSSIATRSLVSSVGILTSEYVEGPLEDEEQPAGTNIRYVAGFRLASPLVSTYCQLIDPQLVLRGELRLVERKKCIQMAQRVRRTSVPSCVHGKCTRDS